MKYFIDFPDDRSIEIECELLVGDIVNYEDEDGGCEGIINYRWFSAPDNTFRFNAIEQRL